jgi:hypothetical protein
MCRCLYNVNDFHCRQTKAELCFDLLAQKFRRPNITMPTHRELFPECVKYINEKDPKHYGPRASALLEEIKEPVQSEPPKFREHLPVLKFTLWKTFIDENHSDPFQLAGYLNEKWKEKKINWEEFTNKKQRSLVEEVMKIIEYFTTFYASRDNFDIIRSLLDEISKDVQILNIGYEKEAVEKNIHRRLQDREWYQLQQLAHTARKDRFPLEFIQYLSEIEVLAEKGMNYLVDRSIIKLA